MIEQVLKSVMLPSVVAAAIFFIGWRLWRRKSPSDSGAWSGALAFAALFVMSFINEKGIDKLKPTSKADWIVHLALAAGVIGLVASLIKRPKWLPWLVGPLVAAAAFLIFKPLDDPKVLLLGAGGLGLATLVCWLLLDPLARSRPGASLPLSFMLVFSGMAIFFAESGGLSYAMLCGAMSGGCGAALVASWLNPKFSFQRGATPALAALPVALLWIRAWYHSGQVPWFAFVLPLAAIPLLWLGELSFITRRKPWVGVIVRAGLAAIPVALAVYLAMNASPADSYYDY